MKTKFMTVKTVLGLIALTLVAVFACSSLVGCSGIVKHPILECEQHKISLAMYEFMLSRLKGELARQKHDVSSISDFWSETVPSTGQTREQYYNESVLTVCKNYLASAILFDREGLKLTDEELAAIESDIADYINYDAQGSEEKLDIILAKYGVTTDELRSIYTLEAKHEKLMVSLYGADGSLIADNVKQEYYEQNYYRFKQIFVSDFHYEYQLDEQGNVIYFDPETSKPIYDTVNGSVIYVDGYSIKDKHGNPIYYDESGKILYNTENGYPTPKLDENGEAIVYYYTDAEMKERVDRMNGLLDTLEDGNFAAFEAEMQNWELYEGSFEYYPDGYYLSRIESFGYEKYMLDILHKLEDMETGEIDMVEGPSGYHIIMKYRLDSGKFGDVNYAEWFASFNTSLMNELFLDKCEQFYDDIKLNENNFDKARSIKEIGINFHY